ncbi:MAG: hypothetical protein ACRD3M_02155 [Thermoanaerobaculia bacterium]
MKKVLFLLSLPLLLALVAVWPARPAAAQEKKEHPQEHPKSEKKVSLEEIDRAIRADVEEKARAAGGSFPVRDDLLQKTWQLELVRVHKDRLQALEDGRYFACVDFKAADGTAVDVDFFLKKEGERLAVADTSVHKVNGKARYNYEEKKGVWVRVPEKG